MTGNGTNGENVGGGRTSRSKNVRGKKVSIIDLPPSPVHQDYDYFLHSGIFSVNNILIKPLLVRMDLVIYSTTIPFITPPFT